MYVNRHYSLWRTVRWSQTSLIKGLLYSSVVVGLYKLTNWNLSLPWQPVSVVGIAVAFYLGFKNNSSYDRTWEARKIWGAIVNDSRTFATAVISMVGGEDKESQLIKIELIKRHLAWLISLRNALRLKRPWEHTTDKSMDRILPGFNLRSENPSQEELLKYIAREEFESYADKTNWATQILKTQSLKIDELYKLGKLSEYKQVWLHQLISKHYDNQGRSERIKNFPLPRQYASTALWMTYFFCSLIPFGMIEIFELAADADVWFSIPISGLIIWLYFLMDKIGDYSENPFEGTYQDVPISTITRSIEIDLLEMLDSDTIPKPYPVENGFSM